MISSDLFDALTPFVSVLEQLGVEYHIGGSVASSAYGVARTTLDVDLVAKIRIEQVAPLVEALEESYYIDLYAVEDAIRRHSSFNVIHLPTMIKLDVFIPKGNAFDRLAFERAQERTFGAEVQTRSFLLASSEDVILRKLEWYDAGGRASERQWNDVLGVLKVQGSLLDLNYMGKWAINLGLSDLLNQALEEAGLAN